MTRSLRIWASRKIRYAEATWKAHGLRGWLSAAGYWLFYRDTYVRLGVDLETWSARAPAAPTVDITRGEGEEPPMRAQGRRCYLVRCGADVAHVSWVILPGDRSRFLALGRGDVEITDSHTTPPYRNRGMYTQVLVRILTEMKTEGFRTAYAHVVLGNEGSFRAMRAAGFRPRAVVRARRLLGVYWTNRARRRGPRRPWAARR